MMFRVDMTPGAPIDITLLLLQVGSSMLATWAGIRIVDDIKTWRARRIPATEER